MKREKPWLALIAGDLVVLALLALFAIELANTQAKSKRDVKARVHERAVLAAALIDTLFQTVSSRAPQARRCTAPARLRADDDSRNRGGNLYLALLDCLGQCARPTRAGSPPQARAELTRRSAALPLLRGRAAHTRWATCCPTAARGVINSRSRFPTRYGDARSCSAASRRRALSPFLPPTCAGSPASRARTTHARRQRAWCSPRPTPRVRSATASTPRRSCTSCSHSSGDDQRPVLRSGAAAATRPGGSLLAAPDGPLFASVTGLRKWVPWVIFAAFAFVALVALLLRPPARCGPAERGARGQRRLEPSTASWPRHASWPTRTGTRALQRRARAPGPSSSAPTPSWSSSPRSPRTTCRSRCARSGRSPSG